MQLLIFQTLSGRLPLCNSLVSSNLFTVGIYRKTIKFEEHENSVAWSDHKPEKDSVNKVVERAESQDLLDDTLSLHIGTLHCSVRYGSRNNYSVVYGMGSWNSVNLRMSLCSARVRFQDSANVSPSSAGIPKRKHLFPKKETNAPSPKWIKMQFSWGTEHWLMDRYPLHWKFILAHGKLMPVKLGGWCIDLSTGTWEINAGQIRGPVHWFIDWFPTLGQIYFLFFREHLSFVNLKTLSE